MHFNKRRVKYLCYRKNHVKSTLLKSNAVDGCRTTCDVGVVICGSKSGIAETVHQRVQSKNRLQIESSPAFSIKRNGKRSIGKAKPLRVRFVKFDYNNCIN